MDKQAIGITCGLISMVAVAIFFFWGYLGNAWDKSWLVFIVSGIACAAVSMIGNYLNEKKDTKKSDQKSLKSD